MVKYEKSRWWAAFKLLRRNRKRQTISLEHSLDTSPCTPHGRRGVVHRELRQQNLFIARVDVRQLVLKRFAGHFIDALVPVLVGKSRSSRLNSHNLCVHVSPRTLQYVPRYMLLCANVVAGFPLNNKDRPPLLCPERLHRRRIHDEAGAKQKSEYGKRETFHQELLETQS
jgi:hypothetical protein